MNAFSVGEGKWPDKISWGGKGNVMNGNMMGEFEQSGLFVIFGLTRLFCASFMSFAQFHICGGMFHISSCEFHISYWLTLITGSYILAVVGHTPATGCFTLDKKKV